MADGPPTSVASLQGVGRRFGSVVALHSVDGTVRRGEITVLLGANGCGKTTLLRLLAGHLPATEGSVRLLGHRLPTAAAGRRDLRRRISYLSQHAALDREMSVAETLHFFAALQGLPRRRRARHIDEWVTALGLGSLLSRPVEQLSGGQRQRLHLAMALLPSADLLLLDEPDGGLDGAGREVLWQVLGERCRAGQAVVMVTHDTAQAARLGDQAWWLENGRVVAQGPADMVVAMQRHDDLSDTAPSRDEAAPTGRPDGRVGGRRGGGGGGGGGGGRRRRP